MAPQLARALSARQFFMQRWEQEYPAFVRVFKALPVDRLEYRPHPRSRSAGELLAFLVASQKACIELCKSPERVYRTLHWHEPGRFGERDEMIATYQRDHEELAGQLRTFDDDGWNGQAWMVRGTQELLLRNTVGGLLWLALFDAVHHRGQLSTYIRPMGGKVPSIYGPSADDPAE